MIRMGAAFCVMAGSVMADAPNEAPRPEPRPDLTVTAPSQATEAPDDSEPVEVTIGQRDLLVLPADGYAACLADLDRLGVVYTQTDPIIPDDDRDCGIVQPVTVTEIVAGVAVTPAAVLRCPTAVAFATWTTDFVLPAVQRLDDRGALTVIENGSGYICRRRNGDGSGKLSEHAFGNAVDIMGFQFDEGPRIAVQPREAEGSMAEAFQDAVRAAACLEFSTVLGPGSNAAHDDHLHLDIVARSSGYRLCEQGGGDPD
ncbi:extensin family protein [Pseudooctadecabacter sp.]|uniref:extensin-like domain-containing protein n=1 Tax=Pseudooctadecabacter sp. TaxID=1966338 RepID=UPI0025D2A9E0|nr:extensin family protein [Pseudooctadecabacter sp.]